ELSPAVSARRVAAHELVERVALERRARDLGLDARGRAHALEEDEALQVRLGDAHDLELPELRREAALEELGVDELAQERAPDAVQAGREDALLDGARHVLGRLLGEPGLARQRLDDAPLRPRVRAGRREHLDGLVRVLGALLAGGRLADAHRGLALRAPLAVLPEALRGRGVARL